MTKWGALFLVLSLPFSISVAKEKVVYGSDNRTDVADSPSKKLVEMSRSTAAMIEKGLFVQDGDNFSLASETLADTGVCQKERFSTQLVAANCSGFLVAPDILVTAGHCIRRQADCSKSFWVFDYTATKNVTRTEYTKSQVYSCKSILKTTLDYATDNDFAVIKLDRPVVGRTPLKIRQSGRIADRTPVAVIGHPSGLPTKISPGGVVRDNSNGFYFVTNVDSFGGNSGSAIIDPSTGVVEGILVRGEEDYVFDVENQCNVVKVCGVDECRGEDATRITNLKGVLARYLRSPLIR